MKRKHEGTVGSYGFKIWKHTIPFQPGSAHRLQPWDPVTLLLTVREVTSWSCSMSRRPNEIFCTRHRKRKQDCLHWVLEEVALRADEGWCHNPFDHACFESAVDLLATYMDGYLAGRIAPGGDATCVLVVRREDILKQLELVAQELSALDLRLNSLPFCSRIWFQGLSTRLESRSCFANLGIWVCRSSCGNRSVIVFGY